jgi:CMP-N-acetylneuraminic acid synthetase
MMNILAVIPVRGESKGIPRKNMRLMAGKPLVYYSVRNALACDGITDVAVTTDDDEIKDYTDLFDGVMTIDRDVSLAGDDTTLDPVVYDALIRAEKANGTVYDAVITLQATSPLLKIETLNSAVSFFKASGFDTLISVVNDPHLAWSGSKENAAPLYKERVNRQSLPGYYAETGAFLITKRHCVTETSRIGKTVGVYEVDCDEAVDIDGALDWVQCETAINRKKIVFRADAYKELGMGHIYNCLTLAYSMTEHEVMFVCDKKYSIGIEKIKAANFPCVTVGNDDEFYRYLSDNKSDIVVLDQLNTEAGYIKKLKSLVNRVVTMEDLGPGINYADAVINALYEEEHYLSHVYSGKDYICLRDEFLIETPKPFSPEVKEVFVMFGGADPSNLTKKVYDMALALHEQGYNFTFAAGMAYDYEASGVRESENAKILVFQDVKRLSRYMKKADIAFISQGRSAYEIASLGIPAIVMSQNERERTHTFAQMENGFLNLGLGASVTADTLMNTFKWLEQTPQIRAEMRALQLRHDLKSGVERVKKIVLGSV